MLEKTCFKRGFESWAFLKKHFIYKEKSGASKNKSSAENLTSVIRHAVVSDDSFTT